MTARGTEQFDWNAATIARLEALWHEGLSAAAIGRRMGISKNAIVGKVHRLHLPARPSPIHARGTPAPARPQRAPKTTLAPFEARTIPPTPYASAAGRLEPAPDVDGVERIDLRRLRVERLPPPKPRLKECCWPEGEGRNVRFCDAPVSRGSYCSVHAARAYVARARGEGLVA